MQASVDIPFKVLKQAYLDALEKEKQNVCVCVPRIRFTMVYNDWEYCGLVCSPNDVGDLASGVGVRGCRNCVEGNE